MNTPLLKFAAVSAAAIVAFSPVAVFAQDATAVLMTPTAACAAPNAPAATLEAAIPDMPDLARLRGDSGTTLVQVDIDQNGTIIGADVAKSSGSMLLDRTAVKATRSSSFRPELRDCEPVAGSYIFAVDFDG